MPCIIYVAKRFSAGSEAILEQANDIIDEYQADGYVLTLRQLYYQFVARDLIANKQTEYKRLGGIINDGRLAGRIDWDAIEDRTRRLDSVAVWDSPSDIVAACAEQYRSNKWRNQYMHLEVWVEKEALAGVFERVCRKYEVASLSCRGYVQKFGDSSWELEALDPKTLSALVEHSVRNELNLKRWDADHVEQEEARTNLHVVAERWDDIIEEL